MFYFGGDLDVSQVEVAGAAALPPPPRQARTSAASVRSIEEMPPPPPVAPAPRKKTAAAAAAAPIAGASTAREAGPDFSVAKVRLQALTRYRAEVRRARLHPSSAPSR